MSRGHPVENLLAQNAAAEAAQKRPMTPPKHLANEAKKVWRELIRKNPHLNRDVYREAIELYAVTLVRHRQASAQLEDEGYVIEGAHGGRAQNPLVGVVNAATSQLARLSTGLGLHPAARKETVAKHEERPSYMDNEGSHPLLAGSGKGVRLRLA
jgi:P27 family predicted phage terminase small subunit